MLSSEAFVPAFAAVLLPGSGRPQKNPYPLKSTGTATPANHIPDPAPVAISIESVVFDLGKVLLDWDPRYYYAQHFVGNADGLEQFITEIVSPSWIAEMDAGKPAALAVAERQLAHPAFSRLIGMWPDGWPHMLRGEIQGTVELVRALKARGTRLYAFTNFSTETFPLAKQRCPTLAMFLDIVVSGDLGWIKPDMRIYAHTATRCHLTPERTLFIDDLPKNVAAGRRAGWQAIQFTSPDALGDDLRTLQLL